MVGNQHGLRWLSAGVILLASIVLVTSARADGRADLKAGINAYQLGESVRAARLLRSSARALKRAVDRARAWLYLGLTRAFQKKMHAAREAFIQALTEDPTLSPDRERIPPATLGQWDAVRRALRGKLRVESKEPRARVFVDGTVRGQAPLDLSIPVGKHSVRVLSADGYRHLPARSVLVTAGGLTRLVARLVPRMGRLKLSIRPPRARLYEGAKLLASARKPVTLRLSAGHHRLTVRAPGHLDARRDVVVEPDQVTVLEVELPLDLAARPWYRKRRSWAWITLGVSAASATVGLLFGASARSTQNQIGEEGRAGTLDVDRYEQLAGDASSKARLANVFFGLTGAAALTSVILFAIGDKKDQPRRVRLLPTVGGAMMAVRF